MLQAFKAAFGSKKVITALVGAVVAIGARLGLDLEPEIVAAVLAAFVAAILGQGAADHGKEAAKIAAGAVCGKCGAAVNDNAAATDETKAA